MPKEPRVSADCALTEAFAPLLAALRCLTRSRSGTKLVAPAGEGRVPLARETAMSNRYARILAAGAAAVLVAALEGPAALAAATAMTWTVRPGGAITATTGTLTLTDTRSGVSDTCASSTMSVTLKAGSGLPGSGIGSISKAGYRCCGHICSPDLAFHGLPWHLNLDSYDAATGVSRGTISHLKISFVAYPNLSCHAVVNGTSGSTPDGVVAVTYTNQTGKLKILAHGGTLHWYHVNDCAGLIHNGDTAALSATFTATPEQDITSP